MILSLVISLAILLLLTFCKTVLVNVINNDFKADKNSLRFDPAFVAFIIAIALLMVDIQMVAGGISGRRTRVL